MSDKVICYYHADMDGIASASIVKSKYPNVKCIKVNYGENFNEIITTDINKAIVIIVDFSFPYEFMNLIIENCKELIWIDHHKTAKEQLSELWDSDIKGIRSLDKAGCELTWEYFYPNEIIPQSIILIGDRDIWKFKYGEDTKAFHEYISLIVTEPNNRLVSYSYVNEAINSGKMLLQKKKQQIIQSFNEGYDDLFEGHKTRIINSNHNVSDIGEYCYKDNNYPIALIWSYRGRDIICSLRSNTIDVGKIAEKYGGGGHKFAAGFKINMELGILKQI